MRVGRYARGACVCIALAAAGVAAAAVVGPSVRAATPALTDVTTAGTASTVTPMPDLPPATKPASTAAAPAPDPPPEQPRPTATLPASPPPPPPAAAGPAQPSRAQATRPLPRAGAATPRWPSVAFAAAAPGPARFAVRQLAPQCRTVGRFTVWAHAGINRVRVDDRFTPRRARAAAYTIAARLDGETVLRTVVGNASSSACRSEPSHAAKPPRTAARTGLLRPTAAQARPQASGVLGAQASRVLPGSGPSQLALTIVLAIAIFLLGIGSLPQQLVPHAAAAMFLIRRRSAIAAAGLAALAAFLVSYFLA